MTDEELIARVKLIEEQSSCLSRHVGCVISDKDKILGYGVNGAPTTSTPCDKIGFCTRKLVRQNCKSGEHLDLCRAVHAEENAILDMLMNSNEQYINADNLIMYVSAVPCDRCAKLICNTKIDTVIALEDYNNYRTKSIFEENGITLKLVNKR